jgi:Fe-S-cluster containining protein
MESGTALRFDEPGGCTFLREGRCTVHGGRPLACRLYPLGRTLNAEGVEAFIEIAPHPETEGVYGVDGTVDGWVAAQGVRPFIDAAQKTYALFERLIALVDHGSVSAALGTSDPVASDWLDVDEVVTRACAEKKQLVPTDVEERYVIYLAALERWIDAETERARTE